MGWRLATYETLPSTSDLCRTLAEAGEPDGYAVLARRQSAARGSRGRAWTSPAGNLSLSVLIRPKEGVASAGQWSLLAAVALAEAFVPWVSVTLKWPNDVLLGGGKLAGILIECAATGAALDWLTIGIGANLASAPAMPGRSTACLADYDSAPDPLVFAEALLDRLEHWRQIRVLDGFAPIRAAWLTRAAAPGSLVSLRVGNTTLGGTFAGLAEDGSLLLQSGGRVRAFSTGEILMRGET